MFTLGIAIALAVAHLLTTFLEYRDISKNGISNQRSPLGIHKFMWTGIWGTVLLTCIWLLMITPWHPLHLASFTIAAVMMAAQVPMNALVRANALQDPWNS